MKNIVVLIMGVLAIDVTIICAKYRYKIVMKDDIISWKIVGIIQLPIFIIICLLLIYPMIILVIVFVAMIVCMVLSFYLKNKGKKSATEPIEAEIIDINTAISYTEDYTDIMYTLTIKYTVDGVEYVNKNFKGYEELDENMKIGNKIMIKYNPKNPNDICY